MRHGYANIVSVSGHRYLQVVEILVIAMASFQIWASEIPNTDANAIADAIYRIEGGTNTHFPYGIKSVTVTNEIQARQICLNTIRNNYDRWEAKYSHSKYRKNYFDFLSRAYCPYAHYQWYLNLRSVLGKDFIARYDTPP